MSITVQKLSYEQSKLIRKKLEHAGFRILTIGGSMLISTSVGHTLTDENKKIVMRIIDNISKRKERVEFT